MQIEFWILFKAHQDGPPEHLLEQVEAELQSICEDALALLRTILVPNAEARMKEHHTPLHSFILSPLSLLSCLQKHDLHYS